MLYLATDYRMVSDAPWATALGYIQASLRDIPASAGFPHSVEWPVEPS